MAQFASDTFTGTSGTELATYSASWTKHTSYANTAAISDANRVRSVTATTSTAYYHSGSPATADYSVSADLFFKETNGGLGHSGTIGRVDTAANTFYMARYSGDASDGWQLYKAVAGVFTQLGSTSAEAITDETSHNIKLEMVGTAIKLYKDGSGTATISATDSAISAAGKAGIRITSSDTNTTGIHIDNFSGDDVASGVTGTGALTTSTTTASGTGTIGHTGTGTPAIGAVTASGTGVISHTGTGDLTVGAVTASGAGTLSHTGTGALTASSVTASGTGTLSHTGTGAVTVGNVTVSGTGSLGAGITGTGAITIGNVTVSGTGTRIGWDVVSDASGSWSDAAANVDSWSIVANASGSWTVQ